MSVRDSDGTDGTDALWDRDVTDGFWCVRVSERDVKGASGTGMLRATRRYAGRCVSIMFRA